MGGRNQRKREKEKREIHSVSFVLSCLHMAPWLGFSLVFLVSFSISHSPLLLPLAVSPLFYTYSYTCSLICFSTFSFFSGLLSFLLCYLLIYISTLSLSPCCILFDLFSSTIYSLTNITSLNSATGTKSNPADFNHVEPLNHVFASW